MDINIAPGK